MAMRFDDAADDTIVAEINVTPLTDVALVLLIIFMISSTAMLESGLQVKLPSSQSTASASAQNDKPTYVTIAKDGKIALNERQIDPEFLETALRAALEVNADKTVIIRGDASIMLSKAVQVMDAARAAGAGKIA